MYKYNQSIELAQVSRIRMGFSDEFQNLFIESLDKAEASEPNIILIEKEPSASILPVMSAMGTAEMAGANVWSAYCGDRSKTLFEQLIPSNKKKILNIEKPPRIEMALLANEYGMNLGTVNRENSSLDPDIISGMMAAVRNFVKDSLSIHTGEELAERGVERFEMQGYNILVYQGNLLNLTLILSGSIPDQLISEMKRVLGQIEDTNQEIIENWKGSMSAIEGIEKPIHISFFASKQYEGEWDFQQMDQHRSKMYDDVLNIVEKQSRNNVLAIIAEDLDKADNASLELLSYVLRNLETSKVLFLGTHGIADSRDDGLKEIIDSITELEYSKSIRQESEINVGQMLEKIPQENREIVNNVLRHGAVLGTLDMDTLQDSTGIDRLTLGDTLEEMIKIGFVAGSGHHLNPSIGGRILNDMETGERTKITESGALALEANHPEEITTLAELFHWLAEKKPEYKDKAVKYTASCAEIYINNFNREGAIQMWLSAYEFSDDIDERSHFLSNAIELEIDSHWEEVEKHSNELLKLSEISRSDKYRGLAYLYLGHVTNRAGDLDAAISYLEIAEEALSSAKDFDKLAQVLNTKGAFFLWKGKNEEALEIFRESIRLCDLHNNLYMKTIVMTNIGYIQMSQGDLQGSEKALKEAYEIASDAGITYAKPDILWHMAMLSYTQEDYERGIEHCKEALAITYKSGHWSRTINTLNVLSVMYLKLGQENLSHEKNLEAYKMAKKTQEGDLLALTHNIFCFHSRTSSSWLEKTVDISRGNVHTETLKAIKEDLAKIITSEIKIVSGMIDSSISNENKLKLAQQLKNIIEQLEIDT